MVPERVPLTATLAYSARKGFRGVLQGSFNFKGVFRFFYLYKGFCILFLVFGGSKNSRVQSWLFGYRALGLGV